MGRAQYDQTLPPFEELVALAQDDPEAFNQFRQKMCDEMITYASSEMQPRLRAQQTHIERVIDRCKNPTHANVALMNELTAQIGKFQDALHGDIIKESADIVPFDLERKQ
ncbi:DUF3135 domain-containing protein [Vibrio sp. vnigr-6D03]|uniref:DUF3135 domain-containing protein n=1 Tax=Vibrio penaeicida TaxID=104609 RepID=A0AAV5NVB1_9VIBR|nr:MULTISPECIES: DUF3135 domain-containing protein [Vibrio]MDP2573155.1 DUF3135 domain-containing protein [Vibrio penaeicida]PKF77785.1 DUF3135 domain-containing protein [Vibrio sp. vnigr-6D03]RTZ20683.1 DUF3135 domain-containing protein [Vibrio penaeicida]GLQ74545.1 hypothetical protein GCM10007932_39060 [Vibrio penaeicida]